MLRLERKLDFHRALLFIYQTHGSQEPRPGSGIWGHVTTTCAVMTLTYHVSAQVNAEDGHGPQGQWNVCNNKYQEGGDFRNVTG